MSSSLSVYEDPVVTNTSPDAPDIPVLEVSTVTLPEPADGPAPDDVRMERSDKQTSNVDVNTTSSVSETGFIRDVISSSSSVHDKPEVVGRSPRAPHITASVVDTYGRYEIAMEPRHEHDVNPTISDSNQVTVVIVVDFMRCVDRFGLTDYWAHVVIGIWDAVLLCQQIP